MKKLACSVIASTAVGMASSLFALSPASATTFLLTGAGEVTASYTSKNCFFGTCVYPDPGREVGTIFDFTLRVELTLPEGGSGTVGGEAYLYGPGYFSGYADMYSSFTLVDGMIVAATVGLESGDDVCGLGTVLNLSGDRFSYTSARCGYDHPEFEPYTWHHENGEGRVLAQYRDGVAVPEPASWALLIFGFGSAGAMLRRRQRQGLATA